jgi:tetratricopeptide (TPR) repeat protein
MSLQGGDRDHEEAIEASLRAANKLNPAFAPGCDALATFYASRNEKLSEAHLLNVQAVQLEPDNLQYRLNTASVLAQEQQFASAVNVLQVAKRLAKNPVETVNVQNRIEQYQRMQAMMDAGGQIRSQGATQTVVLTSKDGRRVPVDTAPATEETHYPAEATGPRRQVKGVLRGVKCSYPAVLTLDVEQTGKTVRLYSNNYFKITFTLGNYDSNDEIKPCSAIEGMKAHVEYAEVSDQSVAGQIVAIELNK